MINYQQFATDISRSKVAPWQDYFLHAVQEKYESYTHGEAQEWQNLLMDLLALPSPTTSAILSSSLPDWKTPVSSSEPTSASFVGRSCYTWASS